MNNRIRKILRYKKPCTRQRKRKADISRLLNMRLRAAFAKAADNRITARIMMPAVFLSDLPQVVTDRRTNPKLCKQSCFLGGKEIHRLGEIPAVRAIASIVPWFFVLFSRFRRTASMTQGPMPNTVNMMKPPLKHEKPRVLVRLGTFHVLILYQQFTQYNCEIVQIFIKFTKSSQIIFLPEADPFSIHRKNGPRALGHASAEIQRAPALSCHPFCPR